MKFPYILLVLIAGLSLGTLRIRASAQQDFESEIAKADAYYYQGQYAEALSLLTPLDDLLTRNNRSIANQSRVKMLIGLTEIALGETEKALARFVQYCTLNPDYAIDESQYPRKVVTVFKEAQQNCSKCVQICAHAETMAASGDAQGLADAKAETDFCGCASRVFLRDEAALKTGRDLMSQGKYGDALIEFQKVLAAFPASEARRDATREAQAKTDSAAEAAIKAWREQFQSRQFESAAATYDRIQSLGNNSSQSVRDKVLQVSAQYQTTFDGLVSSWNVACSVDDRVALNAIRDWTQSLDPNKTIQPAAIDRMKDCRTSSAPRGNGAK